MQERIARLERELEGVRKVRSVQRQGRKRHQWPVAAVVGYTNAGKSTLLNLLTGADVVAENKLFATLDPTTRNLTLPNKQRLLLTDTVGFLRKLPHTLIESFKATLEEVSQADLLIHVVDLSHPRVDEHIEAVNSVTRELGAFGKQTLWFSIRSMRSRIRNSSRSTETDFRAASRFRRGRAPAWNPGPGAGRRARIMAVTFAFSRAADEAGLIAEIHRIGHVLELHYEDEFALIVAHVPRAARAEAQRVRDVEAFDRTRRIKERRLTNRLLFGSAVCKPPLLGRNH